jgi:hypothetical protein
MKLSARSAGGELERAQPLECQQVADSGSRHRPTGLCTAEVPATDLRVDSHDLTGQKVRLALPAVDMCALIRTQLQSASRVTFLGEGVAGPAGIDGGSRASSRQRESSSRVAINPRCCGW